VATVFEERGKEMLGWENVYFPAQQNRGLTEKSLLVKIAKADEEWVAIGRRRDHLHCLVLQSVI
jgi:hypothetical protein